MLLGRKEIGLKLLEWSNACNF